MFVLGIFLNHSVQWLFKYFTTKKSNLFAIKLTKIKTLFTFIFFGLAVLNDDIFSRLK
jgi:hypothetical protein